MSLSVLYLPGMFIYFTSRQRDSNCNITLLPTYPLDIIKLSNVGDSTRRSTLRTQPLL